MDQILSIQIRNDLHSRRQDVIVEALNHEMESIQHRCGVCALPEKHDTFDDVVIVLHHPVCSMDRFPNLAQTDLWSFRHHRYVLHLDSCALLRLDPCLSYLPDVGDQADGAHIDLL